MVIQADRRPGGALTDRYNKANQVALVLVDLKFEKRDIII